MSYSAILEAFPVSQCKPHVISMQNFAMYNTGSSKFLFFFFLHQIKLLVYKDSQHKYLMTCDSDLLCKGAPDKLFPFPSTVISNGLPDNWSIKK